MTQRLNIKIEELVHQSEDILSEKVSKDKKVPERKLSIDRKLLKPVKKENWTDQKKDELDKNDSDQ